MRQKPGVLIKQNRFMHTIKPNDFSNVDLSNIACIISLVAWNKVSHLKKSIHSHHDYIFATLFPRKGHNKIHTYIIPRPQWNGH